MDDIEDSSRRAIAYLAGVGLEEFEATPLLQDAVLRCLTVVGEAVSHLPERLAADYPGVPWQEMKAMRNLVVHEYFGVTSRTVWMTVKEDLPALLVALRRLREG